MTLASGEMRRLTTDPDWERGPIWSPDGKWIVFLTDQNVWRIPAEGGDAQLLAPTTSGNLARYSPDGRQILVTDIEDGTGNIWAIDPETKVRRAVTDLARRPGGLGGIALATDGNYIYFTWNEDIGDIWVADVVDPD